MQLCNIDIGNLQRKHVQGSFESLKTNEEEDILELELELGLVLVLVLCKEEYILGVYDDEEDEEDEEEEEAMYNFAFLYWVDIFFLLKTCLTFVSEIGRAHV